MTRDVPAFGIVMMLLALFSFSVMEVFVKLLSTRVDTIMTLWFRNTGQLLITLIVTAPRLRQVVRTKYPRHQVMRAIFMLSATISFFVGLRHNSLVETNAIAQSAPIFLTIGAAFFLREKIGRHRWLAVGIGIIGTMIILRPGTPHFSIWLMFPVMGALFYSGYALTTRFVGRDEDIWTSLLYSSLIATALLSVVVPFYWNIPDQQTLWLLIMVGVLGCVAQLFLTTAFAKAEASTLAPISYFSVLFSTLWSITIFGFYPDLPIFLGALVIIGAGLYVWHRERRIQHR